MNLTLFLNHRCNLRCSYCYTGEKKNQPMSLATARRAVDFGLEQTESGVLLLSMFGGEPLLESALIASVVDYARSAAERAGVRVYFGVATNATVLSERTLALLRRERFQVQVSIDGVAAAHDATRRFVAGRSSHALVQRNLLRLLHSGLRVRVTAVIDPANVEHLGASFDYLVDLGARVINFAPNYSGAWDDDACARFERALRELGERYIARMRAGQDVRLDPLNGKIVTHLSGGFSSAQRCQFGQQELAVAPSGRLYPCDRLVNQDDDASVCIGSLERGIDHALRDALVAEKNAPDEECAACPLSERCMRWCGCANYETTGSVAHVSAVQCWFERCFIAEADRVANVLYTEGVPAFTRRFYLPSLKLAAAPSRRAVRPQPR
ncbi:MAG: radical SAM protein [Myxococcales bacterium]|nr:radical SAM protein [Myxococcales bacterium]